VSDAGHPLAVALATWLVTTTAVACPPIDAPFELEGDAGGATFAAADEVVRLDADGTVARQIPLRRGWSWAIATRDGRGVLLIEALAPRNWHHCVPAQLGLRWADLRTGSVRRLGEFPAEPRSPVELFDVVERNDGWVVIDTDLAGRRPRSMRLLVAPTRGEVRRTSVPHGARPTPRREAPDLDASDDGLVVGDGERRVTIRTARAPSGWARFGNGLVAVVTHAREHPEYGTLSAPRLDVVRLDPPRRVSPADGAMVTEVVREND